MKKFLSMVVLVVMLFSGVHICRADSSENPLYVYVTVENNVYPKTAGAKWDGRLLDKYRVQFKPGDKVTDVVKKAFDENKISVSGIEENYITEIGGVDAMGYSMYSGWMVTINDWFINFGIGEFYVRENDVISFVYSNDFGADVGSDWGNSSTFVKNIEFSDGVLDKEYNKNVYNYNIILPTYKDKIKISSVAENKNYQVRIYKNANINYQNGVYSVENEKNYENIISGLENGEIPPSIGLYSKNSYIDVEDGDVISVCCGLDYYNSMNSSSGGTVYTFNIKKNRTECTVQKVHDEKKINVSPVVLNGESLKLILASYKGDKLTALESRILDYGQLKEGVYVDYNEFYNKHRGEVYVYLLNSVFSPVSSKIRVE